MKVLHAYKIYRPEVYGGIPQVISMLAALPGTTNLVLVARYFGRGRKYEVDGVSVDAVSSLGTLFSMPLALTYPLKFIWRAWRTDLVVHHAPFPLTDLGILGMPKRTPLVIYWHAEVVGKRLLMRLMSPMIKLALKRANRIVVSDLAIVENSPFLKPHAEKCDVAPFGCDVDYWSNIESRDTVDAIASRHPRLIVAVGRLVGYKGYDVLIRAMQKVDGHAVIIGEGPLNAALRALAADLGVSEKITFAGSLPRGELKAHLHAAKVFALPSVSASEAFGIVQIEAMAAGCPVVNTALKTAVPNIARHELEGLTVPPSDPDALAAALQKILGDPVLARRLGSAGKVRADAEYRDSAFLNRMRAILGAVTRAAMVSSKKTEPASAVLHRPVI